MKDSIVSYTLLCDKMITILAYKLGAPITAGHGSEMTCGIQLPNSETMLRVPTIEQMCEWIRKEHGIYVYASPIGGWYYGFAMINRDGSQIDIAPDNAFNNPVLAKKTAIRSALLYIENKLKPQEHDW